MARVLYIGVHSMIQQGIYVPTISSNTWGKLGKVYPLCRILSIYYLVRIPSTTPPPISDASGQEGREWALEFRGWRGFANPECMSELIVKPWRLRENRIDVCKCVLCFVGECLLLLYREGWGWVNMCGNPHGRRQYVWAISQPQALWNVGRDTNLVPNSN